MPGFFFIVGAQRSGTTYLCRVLDEHPEIEMAKPLRPEPKFFFLDELFDRGLDFYKTHYFSNKSGVMIRGEKSTCYLESEKAAARIARCFPDAKILIILRDPIERAVSNYFFSVNNGLESLPMEEAFLWEEGRWREFDANRSVVSPFAYLQRGRYSDFIPSYEKYFPANQIKILVFEELVGSLEMVSEVYRFLGVDASFESTNSKQAFNQSQKAEFKISPELKKFLLKYFRESNFKLAQKWELNISCWEMDAAE